MVAADLRQTGVAVFSFLKAEDEVPGFLFGLATALLLIVAGEAHHLPRSGEEAGVEVEPGDAQLAVFDAAVVGLAVRDPDGGEVV
jgi:hypothetical protein